MDTIVTARVPIEIKERGRKALSRIGATPTDLVNAAYQYVLANGKLPSSTPSPETLKAQKRTLTAAQKKELEERLALSSLNVPDSFWQGKTYKELLAEARQERYARFN